LLCYSCMNMKPQDLIKAIVAGVGELIKAGNETLKTVLMAEIKAVRTDLTKEIKTLREENQKDHAEIMEKLAESNEAHGKEQHELKERVDTIEHKLHISKN
jgi:C4-dicarboxylate-specific signal transduction histidine kinase